MPRLMPSPRIVPTARSPESRPDNEIFRSSSVTQYRRQTIFDPASIGATSTNDGQAPMSDIFRVVSQFEFECRFDTMTRANHDTAPISLYPRGPLPVHAQCRWRRWHASRPTFHIRFPLAQLRGWNWPDCLLQHARVARQPWSPANIHQPRYPKSAYHLSG